MYKRQVQRDLPAKAILERENIFMMDEDRAMSQDIRPLEILILNLMPIKEETATQLLRALSKMCIRDRPCSSNAPDSWHGR